MCLRRLTYRKKVVIAQQVASALAHVHQKGVVHNDIKLDNVLFSLDGSAVKLVDFGNADWAGTKQTDWRYVPQPVCWRHAWLICMQTLTKIGCR